MRENGLKSIVLAINALLCVLIALLTAFALDGWGTLVKLACFGIAAVGLACGFAFFFRKKEALLKSCFVLIACAFLFIAVLALLTRFAHLNDYPTDGEKIERLTQMIRDTGEWGMAVYVLVQILQVVILPLPAVVYYVPGSQIWGAWTATLLASFGVLIGSLICYLLGRVFGKRVVIWIAGKETTEKYAGYIGKKGKGIFVLMQILPFFPGRYSLHDRRTYVHEFSFLFGNDGFGSSDRDRRVLLFGKRNGDSVQRLGNCRLDCDLRGVYCARRAFSEISRPLRTMARA